MFNEIVMPPVGDRPSARYTSLDDYKTKTGKDFDGEQSVSMRWISALKAAGGRYGLWRTYNLNICGVHAGGMGGGYRSVSSIHRHGVLIHELGHAFGLPHWMNNRHYPYKRTMYGEDEGEATIPNAGPAWAFDLGRRAFISPREEIDGKLVWKKDPMHGGGWSRTKDYMYRHFSDYSMHVMRNRFESRAAFWNPDLEKYATWNQETGAYDKVIENNGLLFPVERDTDVISLLVSANIAVPDASIVYPPIGSYKAGLVRTFDATSPQDRRQARELGYTEKRCNVCLRVTQGNKTRTYLMPVRISPKDDPLKTFNATAINLPARDGDITRAELLYCPDVMTKGITQQSKILYTWQPPPSAK